MTRGDGRFDSEGRRLLLIALQHETQVTIAKRCAVRAQTICALASGLHRYPSVPVAIVLEDAFAIPVRAWKSAPRVSKSTLVDLTRIIVAKDTDADADDRRERAAE